MMKIKTWKNNSKTYVMMMMLWIATEDFFLIRRLKQEIVFWKQIKQYLLQDRLILGFLGQVLIVGEHLMLTDTKLSFMLKRSEKKYQVGKKNRVYRLFLKLWRQIHTPLYSKVKHPFQLIKKLICSQTFIKLDLLIWNWFLFIAV